MQSLVASGRIVALLLLPGLFLLLALRAGLMGGAWTAILAWLGAALIAHLADLARRMRAAS